MPEEEAIDMQKKFVKAMSGAWPSEEQKVRVKEKGGKVAAGLPGRLAETLQAARDGKTLAGVAKARGLVASTIVKHLEELAELGKLVRADFAHLVPIAVVDEIHEALAAEKSDKLAPVFHTLRGRHSFEAIRLVRLMRSN
jgi:uncharacterized protein YpbB